MSEEVHHPDHYNFGDIEVLEAIEDWFGIAFHKANAIKYIARAGRKARSLEITDLRKAREYLDRAIAYLENEAK